MARKNGGRANRAKWDRADKINGIGVLIALLGLIAGVGVPNIVRWVSYLHRPQVSIRWPGNNDKLVNNTFGANGTAEAIPSDADLWLMVKPALEGRWYPVERLPITNDKWNISRRQICPASGLQELVIYMVPGSDEGPLWNYEKNIKTTQKSVGINSVPLDSVVEATSLVQVPANTRPYC
jgi:hypothetical protein